MVMIQHNTMVMVVMMTMMIQHRLVGVLCIGDDDDKEDSRITQEGWNWFKFN